MLIKRVARVTAYCCAWKICEVYK